MDWKEDWKIGERYRLKPDGFMKSHVYRLIDVTEKGLFLFKPCEFDDEIAKKRDELRDLIIKRDTFVEYFGKKVEANE